MVITDLRASDKRTRRIAAVCKYVCQKCDRSDRGGRLGPPMPMADAESLELWSNLWLCEHCARSIWRQFQVAKSQHESWRARRQTRGDWPMLRPPRHVSLASSTLEAKAALHEARGNPAVAKAIRAVLQRSDDEAGRSTSVDVPRPPFKWAGGKARLAARIATTFQGTCRGTYFEPFLGAGAVFLRLSALGRLTAPHAAVLSDLNGKVVEVHRVLRDDVDGLIQALKRLPFEDWAARYYDVRTAYNAGPHEGPAHAARFIWLNFAGFNGLYRENKKGGFNVPVGQHSTFRLPSEARLRAVAGLLNGVELRTASFEAVMAEAKQGDWVYCDPPYLPLPGKKSFTSYVSGPFGEREHHRLAEASLAAAQRGAHVVLSNHDVDATCNLYPEEWGFQRGDSFPVQRRISCGTRGHVDELLLEIGPETIG